MSELVLTLFRLGFLVLLWIAVFAIIGVLRRDLKAPREARASVVSPSAPIPAASQPPRRGRRSRGSRLVLLDGQLAGTVVPLSAAGVTIGRAADNTVVLEDDYVSNQHARIYPSNDEWIIEDLGSTNGCWLNGVRVVRPTQLQVGAKLKIGRTTLQLKK